MCWESAGNVLMSQKAIANYNQLAMSTPDCNMNDIANMDASFNGTELKAALVQDVMAQMPRNTSWQRKVPGTAADVSTMDDATKTAAISTCIPGTPLYMPGHTMIYLGTVNNTCYVISAMGSASDSQGALDVRTQNSVVITPLTVRRRNGNTWLTSIECAVLPWVVAE